MTNNQIWTVVLILLIGSGYFFEYLQHKKVTSLQEKIMERELQNISTIDDTLFRLRDRKSINKELLEKSRKSIDKLLKEIEVRDTTEIDINDALKIINELE